MLKSLLITLLLLGSDYLITGYFSPFLAGFCYLLVLISPRFILVGIATLALIHQLFFTYFQRNITAADIYNFFTHTQETWESFFALLPMFWLPFLLFSLTLIMIVFKPNYYRAKYHKLLLLILIMINTQSTLLPLLSLSSTKNHPIMIDESPLYPKREVNTTILLIIAESMKYDAYIHQKLQELKGFSKKIYAGATNTDVSVPLLLNNQTNPQKLSTHNETNLFRLAKKNGFETTFISMQSQKSLQYITPFLQTTYIDNYQTHDRKKIKPEYDFLLLKYLQQYQQKTAAFIVYQQIGQHAPYTYFKGNKSSNPKENYYRSIDTSFSLYQQILTTLKNTHKPFIMIVTSDHGEFTGEEGRWGHNSFLKTIYEVPFFITSNQPLPPNYHDIRSHKTLSQLITYLLGYHDSFILKQEKSIVNGTMITREDGFISLP